MSRTDRPDHRRELAAFVRACRERTSPRSAGLDVGPRRRTPGLRREEAARLSGVGVTWYTWFEQGRDIRVSRDFLVRLARALSLDRAEHAHLFALAGHSPPPAPVASAEPPAGVRGLLRQLVTPAYVLDQRWDLLAWNEAAAALFPGCFSCERPNLLRFVFSPDADGLRSASWETNARDLLMKAKHDYVRNPDDPAFEALIDELRTGSPQVDRWWSGQDIRRVGSMNKVFEHPERGTLRFALTVLGVEDAPGQRLIVYSQPG